MLEDFLSGNNFEVRYFELSDTDVTLEPTDLLMILAPQRDFMDTELKTLTDFAAAGGSMFITCDYSDNVDNMPNYQSLLRSYGFQPLNGIVVSQHRGKRHLLRRIPDPAAALHAALCGDAAAG